MPLRAGHEWPKKKGALWESNMEFPLPVIWYERNVYAKLIVLRAVKQGWRPSPHHPCSTAVLRCIERPGFQSSEMKSNLLLLSTSLVFYIIKQSYNTKVPLNTEALKNAIVVLRGKKGKWQLAKERKKNLILIRRKHCVLRYECVIAQITGFLQDP